MAHPLKSRRRTIVEWLVTIAVAIVGVLAFEAEVAKPYRIPSASMEPTLHCARAPRNDCLGRFNDRVLVDRLSYRFRAPRRGEVVVFEAPAQADRRCSNAGAYIKRLIGLPGEVVSERRGQVFVDGRPLREPYLDPGARDTFTRTWPRIAPGHYFFMGDNRQDSCDSRVWGTVPRSAIVGRVVATYWPPARLRFW